MVGKGCVQYRIELACSARKNLAAISFDNLVLASPNTVSGIRQINVDFEASLNLPVG